MQEVHDVTEQLGVFIGAGSEGRKTVQPFFDVQSMSTRKGKTYLVICTVGDGMCCQKGIIKLRNLTFDICFVDEDHMKYYYKLYA